MPRDREREIRNTVLTLLCFAAIIGIGLTVMLKPNPYATTPSLATEQVK